MFAAQNELTWGFHMVYIHVMAGTMIKAAERSDLAALHTRLLEEQSRLRHLLLQVEQALQKAGRTGKSITQSAAPPISTPLDEVHALLKATEHLRVANGNLSAQRIAKAFGVSMNQLAGWLKRSRQALAKTPDADSLQNELAFFERVARLRAVFPEERFLGVFRRNGYGQVRKFWFSVAAADDADVAEVLALIGLQGGDFSGVVWRDSH